MVDGDMQLVIDRDLAMLSFTVRRSSRQVDEPDFRGRRVRRSSLWRRAAGSWRLLHHQVMAAQALLVALASLVWARLCFGTLVAWPCLACSEVPSARSDPGRVATTGRDEYSGASATIAIG